jgi:serine/threonine-protein kinase RsbW
MSEAKQKDEEIEKQEPVKLSLPGRSEYALLARLVASNVGQVGGFSAEEVYDLKLAVTEAVTNVIRHAAVESFEVEYRVLPGIVQVTVEDAGGEFGGEDFDLEAEEVGGFGLTVIQSLVDEVELEPTMRGTRLRMVFRVSKSARAANG